VPRARSSYAFSQLHPALRFREIIDCFAVLEFLKHRSIPDLIGTHVDVLRIIKTCKFRQERGHTRLFTSARLRISVSPSGLEPLNLAPLPLTSRKRLSDPVRIAKMPEISALAVTWTGDHGSRARSRRHTQARDRAGFFTFFRFWFDHLSLF
jgi:hypothetical protein